jgi:hypothetical protein
VVTIWVVVMLSGIGKESYMDNFIVSEIGNSTARPGHAMPFPLYMHVFTTINKVAQHAQDTQCSFLFTCTHLLALSWFIDK